MSREQIKKLYLAIQEYDEPVYRAIFTFLLCGRGLEEVLALSWDQVDLTRRSYTLGRRTYGMPAYLFEALAGYAAEEGRDGWVFLSSREGEKSLDVAKAWERLLTRAGIGHLPIEELCRVIGYYAVNYLGLSEERVSDIMGY